MSKEEIKTMIVKRYNSWEKNRSRKSSSLPSYQYEYGLGIIAGMLSAFRMTGMITAEESAEIHEELTKAGII